MSVGPPADADVQVVPVRVGIGEPGEVFRAEHRIVSWKSGWGAEGGTLMLTERERMRRWRYTWLLDVDGGTSRPWFDLNEDDRYASPGAPELRPDSRYNLDNAFLTENYSTSTDVFVTMVETLPQACGDHQTIAAIRAMPPMFTSTVIMVFPLAATVADDWRSILPSPTT